jgi:hypothetical protein
MKLEKGPNANRLKFEYTRCRGSEYWLSNLLPTAVKTANFTYLIFVQIGLAGLTFFKPPPRCKYETRELG